MRFLKYFLIEPCIFCICLMILACDEADLIELMPSNLFKKSQKSVKRRGSINREV
jgi:hypothetical protein